MELRQLEYFVAVAEEASFTRAAARVHVAQPGVSAQIRQLERELGHALLDRSGRSVTLTEVGAAVLPYARSALGAIAGLRETVDELGDLLRGRVRVGMVAATGAFGIADLLAAFHAEHPGIEIELAEDESDRLLQGVAGGSIDLALVGAAGPGGADAFARHVLLEDRLVAAVPAGHALAGRRSLRLRALVEHPLICVPRGTGMRTALEDGCARAGVTPRVAFEAADPEVLAQLAVRGLGVAILPESSKGIEPGLSTVLITGPPMRSRIELVWRREGPTAPAARALIVAARTFFGDPEGGGSRSA